MEHYPEDGEVSLHHIKGGRKLGNKDYYHADEGNHLKGEKKKESHFKHDELLKE